MAWIVHPSPVDEATRPMRKGRMRSSVTIVFTGTFETEQFCDFVDHRARRLDVHACVEDAHPARISVSVEGETDLIDAFEMACSLGPRDCLVLDVARRDDPMGFRGGARDR